MILSCIARGSRGPLVVLEFTGMESGIAVATALADGGDWTIYTIDVMDFLANHPSSTQLDEVADLIATEVHDHLEVSPVLVGYCSAAMLTLQLAASLEGGGLGVTAVVLIDPSRPTVETLQRNYHNVAANLVSETVDGPIDWVANPGRSLELAVAALAGGIERTFAAEDMDDDERAELAADLVGRYRAWLTLLAVSMCSARPTVKTPVHHICSDGPSSTRVLHDGAPPEVHMIEAEAGRMLADPRVRDRVYELSAGSG